MTKKIIKNSERKVSKEPGSYIFKNGKFEKNLKDDAMKKRSQKSEVESNTKIKTEE